MVTVRMIEDLIVNTILRVKEGCLLNFCIGFHLNSIVRKHGKCDEVTDISAVSLASELPIEYLFLLPAQGYQFIVVLGYLWHDRLDLLDLCY